jgi:WD40 repeat protein
LWRLHHGLLLFDEAYSKVTRLSTHPRPHACHQTVPAVSDPSCMCTLTVLVMLQATADVSQHRSRPGGQAVEMPLPTRQRHGEWGQQSRRDNGAVTALAVSPDGAWFSTGGADGCVHVWHSATSELWHSLPRSRSGEGIRFLAWSGTRATSLLATGNDSSAACTSPEDAGKCSVWRVSTRSLFCEVQVYGCAIHAVAWSPDGRHICTVSGDGLARLWSIHERRGGRGPNVVHCMQNHTAAITTVAWCSEGWHIATGGEDGRVTVWEVREGRGGHLTAEVVLEECDELSGRAEPEAVTCVAWRPTVGGESSPDVRMLAQGGYGSRLSMWGFSRTGALRAWSLASWEHVVQCVAWNPNGRFICTASGHLDDGSVSAHGDREATGDGVLMIWDVVTRTLTRTIAVSSWPQGLGGDGVRVLAVAWSPCGKHIYVATDQPCVRIYNATVG